MVDYSNVLARSVANAKSEDAAGCGVTVSDSVRRILLRSQGTRLSPPLAAAASCAFASDLRDVEVHVGVWPDMFLQRVGMPAACLGNKVILSQWVLGDCSRATAAFHHELAHLAAGRSDRIVRGWDAATHAALSREACNSCYRHLNPIARATGLKWNEFLAGIANASSNMDIRHRFAHPWDTLMYLVGANAGEGPRHGEGRNYTCRGEAWNANLNKKEQYRHAWIGANEFLDDIGNRTGSLRYVPGVFFVGPNAPKAARDFEAKHIGGVTIWEREWVKSLANSLHVAQDRGSHREGMKGLGHSDPRDGNKVDGRKWSCDEKRHEHSKGRHWFYCSVAAYNVGFNNSIDSIRYFIFYISHILKERKVIKKDLSLPLVAKRRDTC